MKVYVTKISNINDEKIDKLSLLITKEKKSRIEKFIYNEDKIRTLIGEILIRTIIMEEINIENKNITFGKNQLSWYLGLLYTPKYQLNFYPLCFIPHGII